ncbi:sialate O-acetylesterase, partial [Patescibacteria group bacterium]|nr:sialate O-acetylesterase [Patescibacteria group bacterium]MBU1891181.1 sialate O-acetylesterase [Patescibacteria group bacterium]
TISENHYSVHIIFGQSNAVGAGTDASELPFSPTDEQTKFYYYFKPIANSGGKIINLQSQKLDAEGSKMVFGPEVGLARSFYDEGINNIFIIKVARGATSMYEHWNPDNGTLYNSFIEEMDNALAQLEAEGYTYTINAFYVMQGEADTKTLESARAYKTNLRNFIRAVRQHFNKPRLSFVIGRINDPKADAWNRELVRLAQEYLSTNMRKVTLVDTDSFSLADKVHYDSPSQLLLGQMFADAVLSDMKRIYLR